MEDPILEQMWELRREVLARYGNDIRRLDEAVRRDQWLWPAGVVTFPLPEGMRNDDGSDLGQPVKHE
jgi:hypothetical protein